MKSPRRHVNTAAARRERTARAVSLLGGFALASLLIGSGLLLASMALGAATGLPAVLDQAAHSRSW